MKLNELKEQESKGTYAGVRFCTDTKRAIHQYMSDNNIPNALRPDKLHTTLLYSRKYLPEYTALGQIDPPWIATPCEFVVWQTKPKNPEEAPSNCLVMKISCPQLEDRHYHLRKEHGATHDYPNYETHVTLSYDIGDVDVSNLPNIVDSIKELRIVEEYQEELDLDWAKNKGANK